MREGFWNGSEVSENRIVRLNPSSNHHPNSLALDGLPLKRRSAASVEDDYEEGIGEGDFLTRGIPHVTQTDWAQGVPLR